MGVLQPSQPIFDLMQPFFLIGWSVEMIYRFECDVPGAYTFIKILNSQSEDIVTFHIVLAEMGVLSLES